MDIGTAGDQGAAQRAADQAAPLPVALRARLLVIAPAAAAIALGFVGQRYFVHEDNPPAALAAWGAALALFLFALWRARSAAGDAGTARLTISPSREIALVAVVMAVGIFFRLYKIGSIPPGLNHDGAWEGLYSIKITQGIGYAPFVVGYGAWGHETLSFYIVAAFQIVMGPSRLALQLATVSVGIATIAATYLFVRRLFDTHTALVAGVLLGICGWHMTLSKSGWRAILVPLFVALVFYFLVRAIEGRRWRDFAIAGILLGLSVDTYDAAKVLPLTAAAYVLYEIVRDRSLLTRDYRRLALFGACAAIAFAPLGWYALHHWALYTGRGQYLWIGAQIRDAGSIEPLLTNIKSAFLLFNYRANGNDFFLREPLLDLPLSVFFPLGLLIAIVRIRQRAYFLLLLILAFDLALGIASTPNGNRDLGAVIPVIALSAVFLVEAWRWLASAFPARRDDFSWILVAVLIYAGWVSYANYLGPDRRAQWGFYPEATRVGDFMHGLPAGDDIYTGAGNWPQDTLLYMSYTGHGDPFAPRFQPTTDPRLLLNIRPVVDRPTVFIVETSDVGTPVIAELQRRYPQAAVDVLDYPQGKIIAKAITVPAGASVVADAVPPPIAPGGIERDLTRRVDLDRIASRLTDIVRQDGRIPRSRDGRAYPACVGNSDGELCPLIFDVGAATLVDPRGDAAKYGYWYQSDGSSFTLYASLEGPVALAETCSPGGELDLEPNLYCLHVDAATLKGAPASNSTPPGKIIVIPTRTPVPAAVP